MSTQREPGSVLTVEFLLYIGAFLQVAVGVIMVISAMILICLVYSPRADAFFASSGQP